MRPDLGRLAARPEIVQIGPALAACRPVDRDDKARLIRPLWMIKE
jgi:hypothetical protein